MVVGLSTLFGAYGKLFKSRRSFSTTTETTDRPTVTAIIPALNEERTMPYALASLASQTVQPDQVVVVDDGSTDDTSKIVTELKADLELDIEHRQREAPKGKTVGVKEVSREVETDTVFVLDADTFLESRDYLERLLEPHSEPDVASSFGTVYPIDRQSKQAFYDEQIMETLPEGSAAHEHAEADLEEEASRTGIRGYFENNGPVTGFRNVDYHVQQRFFTDGIMRAFGSTLFPVGAAVMYDREKLVSVFDDYEESHGDDLTNSEDIFVGFAFCERGWANVHLHDTYLRSEVPRLRRTLKQNYLWGSGYLQSAFYFKRLSVRYRTQPDATDSSQEIASDGGTGVASPSDEQPRDKQEQSATTHEEEVTSEHSETEQEEAKGTVRQPMGRLITAQLLDGLYPTTVIAMLLLSLTGFLAPEPILLVVALEFVLFLILAAITRTKRLTLVRGIIPFVILRAIALPVLIYTYYRVSADIVTGNRNWRK